VKRRDFISCAGAAIGQHALASIFPQGVLAVRSAVARRPDARLRIENCSLDIGNRVTIRTVAYNGQVPGPTLRVGKKEMSGLFKDVVNVMPLDSVAVDFVADNPGDALMHCHQQLHMDYGFMQLIRYTG
jgi:FtsP/CotA-like multicopper oxidase with cupredoxin domain